MNHKCPVCENDAVLLKLKIYQCSSCKLEFAYPMPSEQELTEFYSKYDNPRAKREVVKKNSKMIINLLDKYGLDKNSRLLDFGCGEGIFTEDFENWKSYDKYTRPNFPDGKFDFITMWGVLEHLTNPFQTIKDLTEKLAPNGKIALTTIGTQTGIPYQYKIPEHVTWWSEDSVKRLFNKARLKILELSPYFMFQDPKVYLDCVLRAGKVPEELKKRIHIEGDNFVHVPTNEIFVVGGFLNEP
jgi:SAM-dependent methyltransferase